MLFRTALGLLAALLMISAIVTFVASTLPGTDLVIILAMVICSIVTLGVSFVVIHISVAADR